MSRQNAETFGTDIQQNFIGDFRIGGLRNRLVVGLDYFNRNVVNNNGAYVGNGAVYIGRNLAQFNELVLGVTEPSLFTNDTGVLTQPGTDALLADATVVPSTTKEEVFSAYASDVVNITPTLSVMLSLRADRFANMGNVENDDDDFYQTAFSPKLGIVYQPVKDKVSLFANYMNGFVNIAPGVDRINGIELSRTFEPEHANQFEVGTKLNLFNERLSATLSYYDIKVENMVYSVFETLEGATPGEFINNTYNFQNGAQQNKGFEASIIAVPFNGWSILAGYSYNDSQLLEGDDEFVGKRPESAGPRNLVNLWTSYKFSAGPLSGFGLGFGANHGSENMIMNRKTTGTFTLPEYTIYNASAFYSREEFTITLKVDNIGNTEYYKGWSTIAPQTPRALLANFTYTF